MVVFLGLPSTKSLAIDSQEHNIYYSISSGNISVVIIQISNGAVIQSKTL